MGEILNRKLLKIGGWVTTVLIAVILVVNMGCSEQRIPDSALHDLLIPPEDDIFTHITTIVEQGVRRPGYPANVWTENYIEEQFKKYGLQDVHREEVTHHGKDYGEEAEINLKWIPLETSSIVYDELHFLAKCSLRGTKY